MVGVSSLPCGPAAQRSLKSARFNTIREIIYDFKLRSLQLCRSSPSMWGTYNDTFFFFFADDKVKLLLMKPLRLHKLYP